MARGLSWEKGLQNRLDLIGWGVLQIYGQALADLTILQVRASGLATDTKRYLPKAWLIGVGSPGHASGLIADFKGPGRPGKAHFNKRRVQFGQLRLSGQRPQ